MCSSLQHVDAHALMVSGCSQLETVAWGLFDRSKRGQLGLGKDIVEATMPSRVEALAGYDVVKVITFALK